MILTCAKCAADVEKFYAGRQCRSCVMAYRKAWREANPEKRKAIQARSNVKHKDAQNAWRRDKYAVKAEKIRAANRESYNQHRAARIAAVTEHRRKNKAHYDAQAAVRRQAGRKAIPQWADKEAIRLIYEEAARLRDESGVVYHVDHIVPLHSKLVCGLHCEANLQIITASENCSKGNRRWPDMPEN